MSKFQQRHYIEVARVIRICRNTLLNVNATMKDRVIDQIASELSTMFACDNGNFKPELFWQACKDANYKQRKGRFSRAA